MIVRECELPQHCFIKFRDDKYRVILSLEAPK